MGDFRDITDAIYDGLDRFIDGAGQMIGVDTRSTSEPQPAPIKARVVVSDAPELGAGRMQRALPAPAGATPAPTTAMTVGAAQRASGIPAFAISEDRRRGTFMVGNGIECTECPSYDFAKTVRDMLNAAIGAKP